MTHARTRLPLVGLLAVILILLLAPSLWAQSIPSYRSLAETVAKELGYPNRVSEAGAGQVTREVAARIYWVVGDHDFGLLKKKPGQNQYEGCAIDVLLHKPTGITIDIIGASGVPTSKTQWLVQNKATDPRYPDTDFVVPPKPTTSPTPDPPDEPDPPADTLTPRVGALEKRAAGLEAQLAGQAAALAELTERLLALAQRVAILEHAGPVGEIVCVEVEVETSRDSWLPHRHKITVPVCRPKEPPK